MGDDAPFGSDSEVNRAVLGLGERFHRRANAGVEPINLVRVSSEILDAAGALRPETLRSLDAIHLATPALFDDTLSGLITYEGRMVGAAKFYAVDRALPLLTGD